MEREGTAFIGFTYNGKHSIDDFGIYRTSDGNRYNHNLIPQLNDKNADVPGGHGQYYFNSTYKNRQFSIPIAFDHLTEEKFYKMKAWLNGTEIHELIFDEREEVKYSAKVTGTPQLKFVCFEENGANIYKGEGTIQLTCYYPFGYSTTKKITVPKIIGTTTTTNMNIETEIPTTFILKANDVSDGDVFEVGNLKITVHKSGNLEWDTLTGLVKIDGEPASYSGKSYGTIDSGNYIISRKASYEFSIEYKSLYY